MSERSPRPQGQSLLETLGVRVTGTVQGVGFRPFVYHLAARHGLRGWVQNTAGQVEIEVEGTAEALARFVQELQSDAPPLARIESIDVEQRASAGHEQFRILESRLDEGWQAVSPDVATCDDCLRELFDPADRRYLYPFTNCTNCGPRFTIIEAMPYDRAAFPNFITQSGQLLEMLAQIRQVIDSPISITIEGETGCGKDLLARAIHYNSMRRNKRFISVNCAALPETLLESELFGYKRGAFTGADRDKSGLFEEADGGTFFLDEVADMPLSIQAKVLRLLEEKELVRLGETVPRKVDVRILSATNKDLKDQMAKGLFRQDLYYRLSALSYTLPPLRERKEDVPLLVNHFLEASGKKISASALRALVAYDWPGNVRELENEVKKLVLLAGECEEIGNDILSSKIIGTVQTPVAAPVPSETSSSEVTFGDDYSLYDYLAFWEKRFIVKSLKDNRGIKKHAAAALNIPESTLRLKIKQYDIDLDRLDAVN